ncbi:MAG: hypothetical protein LBK95_07120, partial [Bifidobacteriaceae bacterium]|nr:hypothetical protein [Bifidobacteriaceae bacterium]
DQRARKGAAADAAALDGPAEALALTAKQFGLAVDAARAALDRAWLAIDSPPPLDRARAVTE